MIPQIPLPLLRHRQRTHRHFHLPAVTGAAIAGTVVVNAAVAAAVVAAAAVAAMITDVVPESVSVVPVAIAAGLVAVAVVGSVAIVDGGVGLLGENHLLH